jgi:hypothetical protein
LSHLASSIACWAALVACEPRIEPVDGRHSPPERTAWATHLNAPAKATLNVERVSNGAVARFVIAGQPGRHALSARLSGTSCAESGADGPPLVELRVNGESRDEWRVSSSSPSVYSMRPFDLGDHPVHVDLFFVNDYSTETCDRNVILHDLEVTRSP